MVVGSINMDLVTRTPRIPLAGETVLGDALRMHPGGKGANQAVAAARLGYPVQMIGKVGSDVFGGELREHLAACGVDLDGVATIDEPSGVALIVVDGQGNNSIVVAPGANASVSGEYLDEHQDLLRHAGMVLTQLEIPIETTIHLADLCRRYQIPLMLDPAPAAELPPSVWAGVHWITPNETEASFYLSGANARNEADAARSLLARGPRGVLLKMGARGVFLAMDGLERQLGAVKVEARDTTAAGDAFNGAFAVGLQLGKSSAESARFAVAASAISVSRHGAQESMPTLDEVNRLLETGAMAISSERKTTAG